MIRATIVCPYCRYVRKLDLTEEEIRGERQVIVCCCICGNLFPVDVQPTLCIVQG
ncbi:MAG: hypothetical protein QMD46_04840 [Methanomicrobiales archaeon]|nr:hypothetical protein [Methanomicrobiales archaeon]MDI6877399.1 hypothetical protein [Methanomicrobiales archaeon]